MRSGYFAAFGGYAHAAFGAPLPPPSPTAPAAWIATWAASARVSNGGAVLAGSLFDASISTLEADPDDASGSGNSSCWGNVALWCAYTIKTAEESGMFAKVAGGRCRGDAIALLDAQKALTWWWEGTKAAMHRTVAERLRECCAEI